MNKTIKIISIILMVSIMALFLSTNVFAAGAVIGQLDPDYNVEGADGLTNVGQQIISIISVVAIVISVIVLLILGIKYMMGSASEKAEYKKTMIPYAVGAICIFGASNIAKFVYDAVTGNSGGNGGGAVV